MKKEEWPRGKSVKFIGHGTQGTIEQIAMNAMLRGERVSNGHLSKKEERSLRVRVRHLTGDIKSIPDLEKVLEIPPYEFREEMDAEILNPSDTPIAPISKIAFAEPSITLPHRNAHQESGVRKGWRVIKKVLIGIFVSKQ